MKIQNLRSYCKQLSDQKIAAASQATDLLENHLRTLDKDLGSFEKELRARGELSDEEEDTVMQDMYSSHSTNGMLGGGGSGSEATTPVPPVPTITSGANTGSMFVDDTPALQHTHSVLTNDYNSNAGGTGGTNNITISSSNHSNNNNNTTTDDAMYSPLFATGSNTSNHSNGDTKSGLKIRKTGSGNSSSNNFNDLSTPLASGSTVTGIDRSFSMLGISTNNLNNSSNNGLPTPLATNFFDIDSNNGAYSTKKNGGNNNDTMNTPIGGDPTTMMMMGGGSSGLSTTGGVGSIGTGTEEVDMTPYCICHRPAYGQMIGCDNSECKGEWFHLDCMRLSRLPSKGEAWYCPACRPIMERAALAAREGTRSTKRKTQ